MDRTLERKGFNTLIGLLFVIALISSALLVKYAAKYFASWGVFSLLLIYVAIAGVGVMISRESLDPRVTIAGFMLVMIPGGIALSRLFSALGSTLIAHVLSITIASTIVMTVVANVAPRIFKVRKYMICTNIIAVVALEIISKEAGWCQMKFMSMLIAGLFSLYVCYNWSLAQGYERTISAATDTCAEFYLRPIWRIRDLIVVREEED